MSYGVSKFMELLCDDSGLGTVGSGLGTDGSGLVTDGSGLGTVCSGLLTVGSGLGTVGSGLGSVGMASPPPPLRGIGVAVCGVSLLLFP